MFRGVKPVLPIGVAVIAVAVLTQCSSRVDGAAAPATASVEIERADVDAWLGTWTGPITQAGAHYTVVLTLDYEDGTVVGTTDYAELQCAGTLGDADLNDRVLSMVETIIVGADHCITPIDLTLTLEPGKVHYRFDQQGGGDGVLVRQQGWT